MIICVPTVQESCILTGLSLLQKYSMLIRKNNKDFIWFWEDVCILVPKILLIVTFI